MKRHLVWLLVLIPLLSHGLGGLAEGCAACWSGYGPGDERYNKPLADLRILYEKEGKAALPAIEESLMYDKDHLVKQRAATYIGEIKDPNSISVLEGMLAELYKKVSFGNFGAGTPDFQTRMKVAHVLVSLDPGSSMADRIWSRYGRLDGLRKSEVPYLLSALKDPKLCERLTEIVAQCQDHYAMVSALEVLGMGNNAQALPFLKSKIAEWEGKSPESSDPANPDTSMIYYSALRVKAELAIFQIEDRQRGS